MVVVFVELQIFSSQHRGRKNESVLDHPDIPAYQDEYLDYDQTTGNQIEWKFFFLISKAKFEPKILEKIDLL